jgi:regulator of protease activity HflC (stomatin/prohibitin superfamily)
MTSKFPVKTEVTFAIVILLLTFGGRLFKTVPAGHVAVATLFGDVQQDTYSEGLHVPVNPFYKWHLYDVRQKSHKETANVPSQDQLQTRLDISVQYRLIGGGVAAILRDTGTASDVINVHLVPKLRSILREQGKSVPRAEDFFLEATQSKLQVSILASMQDFLGPKGVLVDAVLIRDINLPAFITKAIASKKEREQEVEKQKAELERYRTEQQQLVAQAQAERKAAEEQAVKVRVLADAQAYEIKKINEATGKNPTYITLKALESLQAISKDPAAKLYFINGDSPQPLPLMHLGDNLK